ncbi:hypothetical protein H0H93_016168 [Arthromyces matolae]|nr:hypothetical protein H0H93_016168 [Arthromyces matolae]
MLQEQSSKLLALSTEIILIILSHLPTSALVSLAKTSRRLHYLALPIHLARHGIESNPVPTSLILHERAVPALPGLCSALFINSIDDLWCKFEGPEEIYFSWGVEHLLRFIRRLNNISRVTLNVGNIDTRWVDGLATVASNSWKPTFIQLLNTALERGCRSLTIAHGHFLVASSLLREGSKLEGPSGVVPERTFLGLSLPRRKLSTSLIQITPLNKLASFSIHSNMLLSPPFYEWTLQTLRTSPITSLSLRVSGLSQEAWILILDAITLPNLASFGAETLDIGFSTLLLFLRRHPTITTLGLHPHFTYPRSVTLPKQQNQKQNKKNILLPRLVALRGCSSNLLALLSHLHPNTTQNIWSITIVLPMHQRTFHSSDFDALSVLVVDAIEGTKPYVLGLQFSVPYDAIHPRPTINRSEDAIQLLLGGVETIIFSTDGHFAFGRWVVPSLPTWLGANFVKLKKVKFSDDCMSGVDIEGRANLARSIRQSCKGVSSICIDNED